MLLSIAQQPYRKVSKLAGSPYGIYITVCSPPLVPIPAGGQAEWGRLGWLWAAEKINILSLLRRR